MVFFNTTTVQFHMALLGLVVFQMKEVPHFLVNSLPLMCFLAGRDNWDIAVRIGTKVQRFSIKTQYQPQGGPRLEQRPRLEQFTLPATTWVTPPPPPPDSPPKRLQGGGGGGG